MQTAVEREARQIERAFAAEQPLVRDAVASAQCLGYGVWRPTPHDDWTIFRLYEKHASDGSPRYWFEVPPSDYLGGVEGWGKETLDAMFADEAFLLEKNAVIKVAEALGAASYLPMPLEEFYVPIASVTDGAGNELYTLRDHIRRWGQDQRQTGYPRLKAAALGVGLAVTKIILTSMLSDDEFQAALEEARERLETALTVARIAAPETVLGTLEQLQLTADQFASAVRGIDLETMDAERTQLMELSKVLDESLGLRSSGPGAASSTGHSNPPTDRVPW